MGENEALEYRKYKELEIFPHRKEKYFKKSGLLTIISPSDALSRDKCSEVEI